ncbi:MAG: DUF2938 family protein [Betaproteobacteria bacterium]|nr:DUF2938 family protein [Betaproteobacteria bacterium]
MTRVILVGTLATILLDLWILLLKRLKVPTLDMALLGRWIGHLMQVRPMRGPIAGATPVRGESGIGWVAHYAIGIVFAFLFVGVIGDEWTRQPTLVPALLFGIATVAAPLFILQPAMGAGIASSRTRTPLRNVAKSVVNHAVFGGGIFAAAIFIQPIV